MNQDGLALPNPTKTDSDNWTASCIITVHLVASLQGMEEFSTEYHAAILREGQEGV